MFSQEATVNFHIAIALFLDARLNLHRASPCQGCLAFFPETTFLSSYSPHPLSAPGRLTRKRGIPYCKGDLMSLSWPIQGLLLKGWDFKVTALGPAAPSPISVGGSPYDPPSGYCSFGGPFTVFPGTSWSKAREKKMNSIQSGIKATPRESHKKTARLPASLLPRVWPSFPSTRGPPQSPPCGVGAPGPQEAPLCPPPACHFCCPSSLEPSLGD